MNEQTLAGRLATTGGVWMDNGIVESVDGHHAIVDMGARQVTCVVPESVPVSAGDRVQVVGQENHRIVAANLDGGGIPAGSMVMWMAATVPAGWLLCDGATVSRTTYAGLFAAIGTQFGAGDGSSTFRLPNMRGRFPIGLDPDGSAWDKLGETGGQEKSDTTSIKNGTGTSDTVQDAGIRDNIPPYLTVHYMIKT